MSELKKFISDIGVTFFASAVSMLLGFPLSILIGRYLGAGDLGLYRMVNTIFGILILFGTVGLPAAAIKYVAEFSGNRRKQEEFISSSIINSLVLGILALSLMYLSAGFLADFFNMPGLDDLLKILAFSLPFAILNSVMFGLLTGFREMKKQAAVTIANGVFLLLGTFLLFFRYEVKGTVAAIVISSFITTITLLYVHKWGKLSPANYLATSRELFSFGSKTFISNAINIVNYQADVLMIGYFLSATDVGVYSVAVILGKILWMLPDTIQKITYPMISEYYAKGKKKEIEMLVDKCMKYSYLFLIFSSTFLVFFGKEILTLIYGNEFGKAYFPLIILLIGILFYGTTKSIGSIFAGIGKVQLVYRIPLVSAIINIILNALLIPVYGIAGAAFATSFSLIISMGLMIHYMKMLLGISFDTQWYFGIFGISSLLSIIYLMSSSNLLLGLISMILQAVIFFKYYIHSEDKQKIVLFCKQTL
ncbi:flippase [Methanosarcina sp. 1.H.A.2.2]|uniref:flippase n=1 Tax=Methanosarcina sp. 1.H.A.2.2 TaxID=1483601 RepID=UPI0006227087|nr:flippase [Methanosarcina sp. 1.H.A.2.2]KKH47414.1 polysaccharide biosynthesis protein [Methanosarcina sp. 1.H.A.2.2]